MRILTVLIGFEASQEVCKAFRALGHEAYSCDKDPCYGGHPEWHLQMDIFEALASRKWDLCIFHPPCPYLTVTASRWLSDQPPRKSGALVGQQRRDAQKEAIALFMKVAGHTGPYAIENPVGVMSTVWRKPDQIIQPFQFGHPEPKKTCLWLNELPLLKPTSIVEPEYHVTKSGKRVPKWFFYADKSDGQPGRARIRSKTFTGIATAMAVQWSSYLLADTTIQHDNKVIPQQHNKAITQLNLF